MSKQYFGTDGIRGKVGEHPITPDFMMRLGYAAGRVLASADSKTKRPAVLIGKDTEQAPKRLCDNARSPKNAAA